MSLTQLRAPRLRQPGEPKIEAIIIRLVGLKESPQSTQVPTDEFIRKAAREGICRAITTGIEFGDLTPGDKLPSIRRLAEKLGVPNGVVRRAFEHLLSRGWLEMIHGSGTYVSKTPNLLVGQKTSEASQSVLKTVAEELTALYSTNSLAENINSRQHPRLSRRS